MLTAFEVTAFAGKGGDVGPLFFSAGIGNSQPAWVRFLELSSTVMTLASSGEVYIYITIFDALRR